MSVNASSSLYTLNSNSTRVVNGINLYPSSKWYKFVPDNSNWLLKTRIGYFKSDYKYICFRVSKISYIQLKTYQKIDLVIFPNKTIKTGYIARNIQHRSKP